MRSILLTALLLSTGCGIFAPHHFQKKYVAENPDTPEVFKEAILEHSLVVGMSRAQAKAALGWAAWGVQAPYVTKSRYIEIWTIRGFGGYESLSLYFHNGFLTDWAHSY